MRSTFILICVLFFQPLWALEIPKLTGPVIDLSSSLSATEIRTLSSSLARFKQQYGPQLQVLIIPSLEGETIEGYSIKVVDEWKLGSAKKDDGVLLLIAKQDRKMRIEVGQGLEGDLPDAMAGRIIKQGIAPYFKQQQFSEGIKFGLSLIAESLGGRLDNVQVKKLQKSKKSGSNFGFFIFLAFFLFGQKIFGRRRRGGIGGALLTGALMGGAMSSGHRSSNNYMGGDGFGGFSGGGGGFSGGGASGGW